MKKLIMLQSDLPPEEIAIVESQVRASDFICSGYDLDTLEPYTVRDYLFQKHAHGNGVHAVLDRNLVSSLTAAARQAAVTSADQLEAVRLLNFLRIAEIELEPGISLAEYTDTYYSPNADEELELLRRIDDIPNGNLHDLALSRTTKIAMHESAYKESASLRNPISKAEDLHHWKLHYGHALKIYLIYHESNSLLDFVKDYLRWMWKDYAYTGLAMPFAATFASQRFGGMIKGINSLIEDRVIKGLRNAAWDMTVAHYWSYSVVHRTPDDPFCIFCTADRGLREVARNVITSNARSIEEIYQALLGQSLHHKDIVVIAALYSELDGDRMNPARAVHRYRENQNHFDPYVWELESLVKDLVKQRAQQAGSSNGG